MARQKNSLILYYDFEEQTALLTDCQIGTLIRAMLAYEKRGELPETLDAAIQMAFQFLKIGLDVNSARY